VPAEIYLNVAVSGLLTGLVYGLMALGLSVIFGVVRVVNFAHGEMMTVAMFIAVVLFSWFHLDPLIMLVPIAAVLFAFGYALQASLINPFITRPEHSQFLLLVALAIIIANALLIMFGPDARSVQTSYAYDSFQLGPLIVDAAKLYAGAAAIVFTAALFAFFRFTPVGKAIRACADNYTGALVVGLDVKRLYALTFGLGAACVGAAGCIMVLLVDVTPPLLRVQAGRVQSGSPLLVAATDAGAGVYPESIQARVDGSLVRAPFHDGVVTISTRGLQPGTHRLRLRVSDYQEAKNTENVGPILPNTRWLTTTFETR
jgi:branched-chain amino acid transport system permease protein